MCTVYSIYSLLCLRPLLKLVDKLLLVGIVQDDDIIKLLIMIDPRTWDSDFDPGECTCCQHPCTENTCRAQQEIMHVLVKWISSIRYLQKQNKKSKQNKEDCNKPSHKISVGIIPCSFCVCREG